MHLIVDIHIHSHYSRATSKTMNLADLAKWGKLKGIDVLGTGDFTHPKWFEELRELLEPAEEGLFKLNAELEQKIQQQVPSSCWRPQRFILSVEISTIYKKNGRVRKLHNLILAPSFEAAAKLNAKLQTIGNLKADGRPILGLDAKILLQLMLESSKDCLFIPAHAWTPHFSVFGSQSGFDSLEEAFAELTPYIYAIETGLSSDPAMNWRLAQLDKIALVSNSDAHSPGKLGREANIFNTELSYTAITNAIRNNDRKQFLATIEFFPEEGKYHLDGHRACGVVLMPTETKQLKGICPKCHQPLTIGVLHRVDDLATYPIGRIPPHQRPYYSIIPLPEILAEINNVGITSKVVQTQYVQLLQQLGNEFSILLDVPIAQIAKQSATLAEAIKRMRAGNVFVQGGYDGEYGVVKVFTAPLKGASKQLHLL